MSRKQFAYLLITNKIYEYILIVYQPNENIIRETTSNGCKHVSIPLHRSMLLQGIPR